MKIIALPDIHGRTGQLKNMAAELSEADVVLLVGDLTDGSIDEAMRVVNTVRQYNERILAVPGNMDTNRIMVYLANEGMNIHRRYTFVDDVAFMGVGGALPFAGRFVFSEMELTILLNEAVSDLDPDIPQVLVCHQPPIDTLNDLLHTGDHVGSKALRLFIRAQQPLICFTGHIHEGVGIDAIDDTPVVNPGPLWREGKYAYAEIEKGKVVTLEIRKVRGQADVQKNG